MYEHIALTARCIGKTKTIAKIAKKIGAKVCCADKMSAKRLRREYGVDAIIVDNAEHFRGCYAPIVYDADTVTYIVCNMNNEMERLRNEIKRLQNEVWKLIEDTTKGNTEMDETKLWLVRCRGLSAYILAEDPNAAYQKLCKVLDEEHISLKMDRALLSIELLADNSEHPESIFRLIL